MPLYEQGIQTPYASLAVIPNEVYGRAINWNINRTPLFSRAGKHPVNSMSFLITAGKYLPGTTTMNDSGGISNSDTTMTVTDGTIFMVGDVINVESEYMLVTAVSGNDLTITRAYGGTTAASHADALTVYRIANSRTGAEVDQLALNLIPTTLTQYLQTFQHPYQTGGSLESASPAYALPPGVRSVSDYQKMLSMQACADDFERSAYYGKGVALAASTTRPAQSGLRAILSTNNTTSPTNASAYKPSDLIRDTIQKCYDGGGSPNVMLVSSDFLTGLATWGHAAQRIPAGENSFGTPIDTFECPFLTGITIIPAPLLRPGSAICCTFEEIRVAIKRQMHDKPRGSRGDAVEGDIIFEAAVDVTNEAHHAWVSGITAFSAT